MHYKLYKDWWKDHSFEPWMVVKTHLLQITEAEAMH